MRTHRLLCALILVLLGGTVLAAGLKSGPQVDEKLAGPFHPLNVNGAKAGQKNCLYCQNGNNPFDKPAHRSPRIPNPRKTYHLHASRQGDGHK